MHKKNLKKKKRENDVGKYRKYNIYSLRIIHIYYINKNIIIKKEYFNLNVIYFFK